MGRDNTIGARFTSLSNAASSDKYDKETTPPDKARQLLHTTSSDSK